jgi:DNA-binding transcriptional regulator YiaG
VRGVSEQKPKYGRDWDQERIRALRQHLGLSQDALADELGTRQQTVSEWETGRYQPRGASARLLSIVAERAGFVYGEKRGDEGDAAQRRARERLSMGASPRRRKRGRT